MLFAALAALFVLVAQVGTQGPPPGRGAGAPADGLPAAAREVLVKFNGPLGASEQQLLRSQMDADEDQEVGGIGVRRIHSRSFDTDTLVAFLRNHPRVIYVEPNYIVQAVVAPDDPQFPSLWGLQNLGVSGGVPGADIKAVPAWDISTGSIANVVGVVDTGIDYNHPDLAANVWSAPGNFSVTIGGNAITCPAGSHGFRSINNAMTCDPLDDHYHGTHVSGTIGAVGNNSVGVVGVNWVARVMGLKFLNSAGSGFTSDAINVIEFAIQAKARFGNAANLRVLSNSWGGGGASQALLDEIVKANTNNMLFVAAAGNNGSNNDVTNFYPANYAAPNMLAVAATTNTDALASFSNYGATKVHIGAPGQNILSTSPNNTYQYLSGTSMATPHVSGAAALLLSACTLDTAALKSTLINPNNTDQTLVGWVSSNGRLNVNKAIRACHGSPVQDFGVSATPSSQTVQAGSQTTYGVTVSGTDAFGGTVTLSASSLPAGATASFNPASVIQSGPSTMTVMTSGSTPAGSYTLTVTGTSGALVHSTTVTLVVTAPPPTGDFALSASPSSRTVLHGKSTTYSVSIAPSGGFAANVTLTVSGLPNGASASSDPNPAGLSSTLTVDTGIKTRGTHTLTITGTAGPLTHNTTVTLTVR